MAEAAQKDHQARYAEAVYKGETARRNQQRDKEDKDFYDVRSRYDRERDFIDR